MKLGFQSRAMVLQSHTSHSEETVLVLLLILPPAVHRKELLVPEPKAWSWNDRCQLHLPLVASNLTQESFSMAKAVDINNQYFQYFMTSSYLHKKRLRLIDVQFIQPCILYVLLSSWPRVLTVNMPLPGLWLHGSEGVRTILQILPWSRQ